MSQVSHARAILLYCKHFMTTRSPGPSSLSSLSRLAAYSDQVIILKRFLLEAMDDLMKHSGRNLRNVHARQGHHILHDHAKHRLQILARRCDEPRLCHTCLYRTFVPRRERKDLILSLTLIKLAEMSASAVVTARELNL